MAFRRNISTSLLDELLQAHPHMRTQNYFKSSLIALCHAMEDQVLVGSDRPLIIASFQCKQFYYQEVHKYLLLAKRTEQLYILTCEADDVTSDVPYEIILFDPSDPLSQEWHLIVLGQNYASCLLCREQNNLASIQLNADLQLEPLEQARRFEGLWTFDRSISCEAAHLWLKRILLYRPELASKINRSLSMLTAQSSSQLYQADPTPLTERLVTYLQTSQYKLLKAYNQIAAQENKERLVNAINAALRCWLNPSEILQVTVQKLGQIVPSCRSLIYPCKATDRTVILQYEFLGADVASLSGQTWFLQENPLLQAVVQNQKSIYIEDTKTDPRIATSQSLQFLVERAAIRAWLLVPVLYQTRLLGMVELHFCGKENYSILGDEMLSLVELIASLIGVALQALPT